MALSFQRGFWDGLRFGFRMVRKSPVLSGVAVFCLAAGIGLSTFMFSVTYSIVGRGLPFPEQDRILTIMRQDIRQGGDQREPLLVDDFRTVQERQTQFSHLTALTGDTVTVGLAGFPNIVTGFYTSPDLFRIMPGDALMGRTFTAEDAEAGADPVLILSYRAWVRDFASDPEIIGKECLAEGRPYTIVGVMPEGYDYPFGGAEVWMPLVPETLLEQTGWIDRVMLLGLLGPEASLDSAEAELEVIFKQIEEEKVMGDEASFRPYLQPLMDLFIDPQLSTLMWTMFAATLLVLLIACTNVSSLLSARLTSRENELAVRTALGANRKQIIFQILAESLLTAAIGTVAGLAVAAYALRRLWLQVESFRFSPPAFMEFRMDGTSLIVAVVLMILSVLLASLLPALRASRTNLGSLLNDSGRTASNLRMSRFGTVSPILQLAFSLALLVAAGRLVYALMVMTSAEFPFEAEGLLIGSIAVDSSSYPDEDQQIRFWEELQRKLEEMPDAEMVSMGFNIPSIPGMGDPIQIEGESYASEDDHPFVRFDVVTPGYFETLGIPFVRGRDFTTGDIKGNEQVAIINTVMAERFWPGEDPVGRYFLTSNRGDLSEEERRHRIIGVVPDLAMHGLFNEEEDGSGFYRAQGQGLWGDQKIFVRTANDPETLIPEVQKVIAKLDPNIAFTNAKSFIGHLEDASFYFKFFLNLFSVFGIMALLLAATGVFGIIQYVVSLRTTEIGIRLCLGASSGNIRWMILRKGLRNAVIGIAIGSFLAYGLSQVLGNAFPMLGTEYVSYAVSVLILFTVAFVANIIPALRASRLMPMRALREG
jgi:putative ABC transport system permease protein